MRAAQTEAAMGIHSDRGAGPVASAVRRRMPDRWVLEIPFTGCAKRIAQALNGRRPYAAC